MLPHRKFIQHAVTQGYLSTAFSMQTECVHIK